jgi:CNT family concentrative nucleoside transporter
MEKVIGLAGVLIIVGIAVLFSTNRRAINWRTVLCGLALQFALALLILKVPFTRDVFAYFGQAVEKLLDYAVDGAAFVFGDELARGKFIFVVRVGSSIVFVAALSALLYYLGIMQRIVKVAAFVLSKTLGISGPEAVSTCGATLVGQVECQVLIKPYLPKLTTSQLFCSITAAMATISGSALVAYTSMGMNPTHLIAASLMSAVGGIVMAKIFIPETDPKALMHADVEMVDEHNAANAFDAMASGAMDGARIAANVMVMVLVAVATVALMNGLLGASLSVVGLNWTVQDIFGVLLTPLAVIMGVPLNEAFHVGHLMATEILVNEFAAYGELTKVIAGTGAYSLAPRTQMITTMALCGFANLGSIAINIGGLSAMAPERRGEIAKLSIRALIAANFATHITACMAGLVF